MRQALSDKPQGAMPPAVLFLLLLLLPAGLGAVVHTIANPAVEIQPVLDGSAPGDTVLVFPGTYAQRLTIPSHDLTLMSRYPLTGDTADFHGTILDGELEGVLMEVMGGHHQVALKGLVITGGWSDQVLQGGGLWVHENVNLELVDLIFTGNGSGVYYGFGAAAYGGFSFDAIGDLTLRRVRVTANNQMDGVQVPLEKPALALRSYGKVVIEGLDCDGQQLNDPAVWIDTTDSLFADSIFVRDYVGVEGTVAYLEGGAYAKYTNILVQGNRSMGGGLLDLRAEHLNGFLDARNLVVAQNQDSSMGESVQRYFLTLFSGRSSIEDIHIHNNHHITGWSLFARANRGGMLRNLVFEDNEAGALETELTGAMGTFITLREISLEDCRFHRNEAYIPLVDETGPDRLASPLIYGLFQSTAHDPPDTVVWRNCSFRDNRVTDATEPGINRYGLKGRAVYLEGLALGTMLFDSCEWVNHQVSPIIPEMDLFPGPRNVGSTVELEASVSNGHTEVIFTNCLFQDNQDGGLYISEHGRGLIRNCQFINNSRFALKSFSNQDGESYQHIQNVWIHGTNEIDAWLPSTLYQGVMSVHGDAGALIENVTVSDCSTTFCLSVGNVNDGLTEIRNSIFWNVDVDEFIREYDSTPPQDGVFSYCLSEHHLEGVGNLQEDPSFHADLGVPYLGPLSPCVDAGDPGIAFRDVEDSSLPGMALWPSQGGLRNDIGATGGPFAFSADTNWVGVEPGWQPVERPAGLLLGEPYPNPFNPVTHVEYWLQAPGTVELFVFDMLGRRVMVLEEGPKGTGWHVASVKGNELASGVYVLRLDNGVEQAARKIVLLR